VSYRYDDNLQSTFPPTLKLNIPSLLAARQTVGMAYHSVPLIQRLHAAAAPLLIQQLLITASHVVRSPHTDKFSELRRFGIFS